ncbi:small ribosomal subunit protein uS9m isoform X1 [Haemorhous mexicanus]|uniref:small ribosomal subunit protein uS9m isoform X1 n=1 Tax=Haemorhous mexicanus TaxID=30427 RepID=UPI0028BD7EF0|nr:small ribosomal subunit protein uS9m isoform X1 [Haemorhous mexicanus]
MWSRRSLVKPRINRAKPAQRMAGFRLVILNDKLQHKKFHLNMKNFFALLLAGTGVYLPEDLPKPPGSIPVFPAPGDLALAGGVDWVIPKVPSNPDNAVILSMVLGQQTLRLICTTTAVQRKNVGASGPEKYTEAFIKKQIEEFNLGKRHLANMMGEDPETFTQEDIDRAIAYLFPSGLFDKQARPLMKHPTEVFPEQRKIQWGEDGRPFHFLFYTGKQSYYSLMHETYEKFLNVQKHQDQLTAQDLPLEKEKRNLAGSRWLTKIELEEMLLEQVSDDDYSRFIQLLQKLVALPCADIEEKYIQKFSKELPVQLQKVVIEPLQHDERGVAFSTGEGKRKTARATAVVYDNGTGKITVNGIDILHYFPVLQDREQLLFPFQFLGRIGKHDMVCTVSGGGRSAQAGAIRLASAKALRSFVTEKEVEFMRQAGLLTVDPRVKERKKPGQEGARRKFTWKKR